MKRWLITLLIMMVSSILFAAETKSNHKDVVSKITNAWKKSKTMTAEQDKNDLLIVYGGEDISLRPTILSQSTTA